MAEASRAAVAYLGIDVGKRSHSACALDAGGEVVFRSDLENRPDDIDRLPGRAGAGGLVVVDQKRNIGARARPRVRARKPLRPPARIRREAGPRHLPGRRQDRRARHLGRRLDVPGHDELASRCGVAPADSRSGTSVRSTSPQRGGSKQLKNLVAFSRDSLIGADNGFGRRCDECGARGMRRSKALKAVARKRLKVIYAIMRDAAPYSA